MINKIIFLSRCGILNFARLDSPETVCRRRGELLLATLEDKIGMHDFLLAKEIVDELKKIVAEKKIEKLKKVTIELGSVVMAHDGHPEHAEDISLENLNFGLKSIAKESVFQETEFEIKKIEGDSWKIIEIEV
jgi:Zn finger protein HypA/HybF involved in hydrogenase expression